MFSSIFCLVKMYNINACDSWTFISNGYLVSLLFYFLLGNNVYVSIWCMFPFCGDQCITKNLIKQGREVIWVEITQVTIKQMSWNLLKKNFKNHRANITFTQSFCSLQLVNAWFQFPECQSLNFNKATKVGGLNHSITKI